MFDLCHQQLSTRQLLESRRKQNVAQKIWKIHLSLAFVKGHWFSAPVNRDGSAPSPLDGASQTITYKMLLVLDQEHLPKIFKTTIEVCYYSADIDSKSLLKLVGGFHFL